MEVEAARRTRRELLQLRAAVFRARKTLEAAGFDPAIVQETMAGYADDLDAVLQRDRKLRRVVGIIVFPGAGAAFGWLALGTSGTCIFAGPLLAPACWGLLRAAFP